ncbi:hypothetical protein BH23ACT6_BH23ACT6_15220 [soil metagenome]
MVTDAGAIDTDGCVMKKSRDTRALQRGSRYGRALAAGQSADAEFEALKRYWSAGLPVPYPVQLFGTEILMEFIGSSDGVAAPRLAQVRGREFLERDYRTICAWFRIRGLPADRDEVCEACGLMWAASPWTCRRASAETCSCEPGR